MTTPNMALMLKAHEAGVPMWKIALKLGYSEGWLFTKLRREPPDPAFQEKFLTAVASLGEENGGQT